MENEMSNIAEARYRAERALRDGRVDDGIIAYRDLMVADPSSATDWYNLGYLLRCARRYDDALAAYGRALELGIDRPEDVHLNRAVILSEFREQVDAAMLEIERAIALAPDYIPAWLNLGNLQSDHGRAQEARVAYDRVLALDPLNGRAHAKRAAIDIFKGHAEAAERDLRIARNLDGLGADDVAEILFALAAALDAQARHDAAFEVLSEAHRIAAMLVPESERYDPIQRAAMVDALIGAVPGPAAPPSPSSLTPIFVCGMFRSGSTLVERMLGRHDAVVSGGELDIIPAMVAEHPAGAIELLTDPVEQVASMRDAYIAEVRSLHPEGALITDKRPDNFLHIGFIKRMFPDAKIINTVRNDLDTALSIYFLYFDRGVTYGHDLAHIGHWIIQYRRLMEHWRAMYPGDIFDVSYDAIVRDPETVMRSLLNFCELDWNASVLQPDQNAVVVRTASVWQVRQSLHTRSSGRWRNYRKHLAPLIKALGRTLPED